MARVVFTQQLRRFVETPAVSAPATTLRAALDDVFAGHPRLRGHVLDDQGHLRTHMGFGGAGVLEIVEDDAGGTYRAVYTVKFEEAMFVLHCFQKKSKHGIATPNEDLEIIRARLKCAELLAKDLRDGETHR
jgi:phage-related protein